MADFALIADSTLPAFPDRVFGNKESVRPVPAAGEPSDEELLRLVASRSGGSANVLSAAALEELFLRHAGALGAFLQRFLSTDAEAEDLVHDAFIRVAEKAATFREESTFRSWLFSLALNLARSRCRRDAVKERARESGALSGASAAARANATDPAQSAQQKELRTQVDRAIAALPKGEREVFLLYWFGELPYAEISLLTGISSSAAKVRVHRALARLGEMLEEFRNG